jgi:hypothetical protein
VRLSAAFIAPRGVARGSLPAVGVEVAAARSADAGASVLAPHGEVSIIARSSPEFDPHT